jgi:hypothetical protein
VGLRKEEKKKREKGQEALFILRESGSGVVFLP